MFSLLAVIIALLLVSSLALATIYFGGSAFTNGTADAHAARLQVEGAQISGAAQIHRAQHGQFAPDIAALVASQHLTAAPNGATWSVYRDTAVVDGVAESACLALNKKAGVDTIPLCTDPAAAGRTLCCELVETP